MGRVMEGTEGVEGMINGDERKNRKVVHDMGFNDSMRIVKGGVNDMASKLAGNPQRTVVQLTAHGKMAVNDEGVDGLKGQILMELEGKGSRTISQLSQDCQVPVMTVKRIIAECAKRNPPLVQVN